jgi:archaellum component FlaF (FlaF/FlaG flagellin family)
VSDDGRYVTFQSGASNLVPDDTKDWMDDVFVRDRQAGSTIRVSETVAGASANGPSRDTSISGNGQYVVYESEASNLVPGDSNSLTTVFVREING